ncbi:hypothetical protein JTE90_003447 [Oedothorax gibbosus]|uniref:Peptidase aspartic putative domain-containing protein n=1 Tax=Oedothorax gibbosus TaxID=931172 RepID=A0AAV6TYH4_9ARAC|nr:hypothetical protein JTE90_003447 [Oedothorax gibbosus]
MDLKTVLNQKKSIKSSITRTKTKTEGDIDTLDFVELDVRKSRISGLIDEVKDIFSTIINKCKDDEVDNYSVEKDELLDILETLLAQITRHIRKHAIGEQNLKSSQVKPLESTDNIKLPTLSLPTFSGVIEEWLTFSDLFKAAVSDNQKLSGAQKLQYLKGVLKSDAQKIVQSLPITDSNFQIAWDLLTERYFNKREILSSVMKKFMNLASLNHESHSQMLNLVDSTKEFVRTLESLEFTIDKATDTFLMFFVLFKLDPSTRTWFERTLQADNIPKLEELLQFLSTHARSIMTGTQNTKRNFQKKVTLVASNIQSQCPFCHNDHALGKCEGFTKLPIQKRLDFVKANNVCFNCLAQFHAYKSCKSKFRCRTCKKPHHTLLHMEGSGSRGRQNTGSSDTRGLSIDAPEFSPGSFSNESTSIEVSGISGATNLTTCVSNVNPGVTILLCTALIRVKDFWDSTEEAVRLITELQEMMRRGGFCLRKWKSSDPSIFKDLPHDSQESDLLHLDDSDCSVLGVKWSPKSDDFKFAVPSIDMKDNYTKREVLSQIARAFDPLGLLSPCVIFMKIVLQELWQANLSWDQPLPEELSSKWRSFLSEIVLLQQVTFPRYVLLPKALVEIHAFCDASEKAYCAVLYARSISSDSIRTVLLTSKTRVAPLKVQSLPRLELCSALLLSNLLSSTLPHLDISISAVFAWSDSQITLAWINSEPSRWKPFVANRVSQIHPVLPYRHDKKLMFPLCRTCSENLLQEPCHHDTVARKITGTWVTEEVKKAVEKGYAILKVHEMYHFSKSSDSLFKTYIDTFLKTKQESSGWTSNINTEEEQTGYLDDYLSNEGIQLDNASISLNPGKRAVSKLALNSFWGRWEMNRDKSQLTYIRSLETFNKLLSDNTKSVETNDPPLGNFLGEFTDELDGETITKFISGGPKNYSYITSSRKSVCKIRDFTLNYTNSLVLNFDAMDNLIKTMDHNTTIPIINDRKICRDAKKRRIFNWEEIKRYGIVYNKRVIQKDWDTLPYGY